MDYEFCNEKEKKIIGFLKIGQEMLEIVNRIYIQHNH